MNHSKEPGAFKTFLACKCPRCRKGDVFLYPMIRLDKLLLANDNCPECEVKFEQETGFYWSAMYISYGLSTGLVMFLGILMVVYELPLFKDMRYFGALIGVFLVQVPFSFRYSRMLAIHLISPYKKFNPNYKTEKYIPK
jgi:uncharacterized protein (DUF983 family)